MPRLDATTLVNPEQVSIGVLRDTPVEELRVILIELMGIWLKGARAGSYVDGELLDRAGMKVGLSGHGGLDVAIEEWARTGATTEHLAIAGWWLGGFWSTCSAPDEGCLRRLVSALTNQDVESPAYMSLSLAALQAFRREEFASKEWLREGLKNIAERMRASPRGPLGVREAFISAGMLESPDRG